MSLESSVTELVDQASNLIDVFNAKNAKIEAAIEKLSKQVSVQSNTQTLQVGPTGDYETINEALAFAATKIPAFDGDSRRILINLQSGFVMQEQIILRRNTDFSFVEITSDDEEVSVDPVYITTAYFGCYPLFAANQHATLPNINVLFRLLPTGKTEYHYGIYLVNGSSAYLYSGKGFMDFGGRAAFADSGSYLSATGAVLSGAGLCAVLARSGSVIVIDNADLTGGAQGALDCQRFAIISASGIDASNNNGIVASASYGGYIYAYGATLESLDNYAISLTGQSGLEMKNGFATGNATRAVSITELSSLGAVGAVISGGLNYCLYATRGSVAVVAEATVRMGSEDNTLDMAVVNGSTIYATAGTVGGFNVAVNTLTDAGIIYQ